ncbi:MAG: PIN domain-containing protein [Bacteroidales bacterium]|nr:PIN domain-containing protein [Bacteroidales bacterium]
MVKKKKYLLDTSVCVALLRKKKGLAEKIAGIGLSNCCISDITMAEITFGAVKSENVKHSEDVKKIKTMFKVLPSNECYQEYAEIRVALTKVGLPIMDFDTLIAATAIHNGLTLVTHNTKHFQRILSLDIEDWE